MIFELEFTVVKVRSNWEKSTSVIHVKKLNQTGMDRMGLRSEAMSWARRNRDVGESEMSC